MKPNNNKYQLTAKTLSGLEEPLADELKAIGAGHISMGTRVVEFTGDLRTIYLANLWCRAALRILVQSVSFPAADGDQLYEESSKFPWEEYFGLNDTFAVDAVCIRSEITHSQFAGLRVKDAIVDRFRKLENGQRPNVDKSYPDFRINVHISSNICTLSFDSSGESLHRRGYRTGRHEAPMSEVLGAGLILLSGWDMKTPLIDPMCGAGTFLTEAALLATNTAPGLSRPSFAFQKWKNYDEELWNSLKEEAKAVIKPLEVSISGSDSSSVSMMLAKENIDSCGFEGRIPLDRRSFERMVAPTEPVFLIMNPPYGERLQPEELNELYAMIGTKLKNDFAGSQAWIISPNIEAMKNIGLKTSRKITVFNGPLECKFMNYKMFKGSLKEFKTPQQ